VYCDDYLLNHIFLIPEQFIKVMKSLSASPNWRAGLESSSRRAPAGHLSDGAMVETVLLDTYMQSVKLAFLTDDGVRRSSFWALERMPMLREPGWCDSADVGV
jgi:hypothetical protein